MLYIYIIHVRCKPYVPTFDRAGSQLKFGGDGGLIPHEDKWK